MGRFRPSVRKELDYEISGPTFKSCYEVLIRIRQKRIKISNLKILTDHFLKVGWSQPKNLRFRQMWCNMDELGFMMGRSDHPMIIGGSRGREMTGNFAQDGNREYIEVSQTNCGDGRVLPPPLGVVREQSRIWVGINIWIQIQTVSEAPHR